MGGHGDLPEQNEVGMGGHGDPPEQDERVRSMLPVVSGNVERTVFHGE